MKKLLLSILILSSLGAYAKPITDLVDIPYPIKMTVGYKAYTDGKSISIGTDLWNDLSEEELGLVILHESYHIRLNHKERTIDDMAKFCNVPITDQQKYNTCWSLYKSIKYVKLQDMEHEADMGSFLTAKSVGYSTSACNIFLRLKERVGEPRLESSHPQYSVRYSRCIDIMKSDE
jgi:hypothetical protein